MRFLNIKATCFNSFIDYLAPALLATTACLSARNRYTVEILKNNYLIYIQSSLATLAPESNQLCSTVDVNQLIGQLLKDNDSTLFLDSATSSGLVIHLATKNRSFLVSPERFDVVNKLLKSDDENANDDDQNASVTLQAIFWKTRIILVCFKKEIRICNINFKISLATFNNFSQILRKRQNLNSWWKNM